MFIDAELVDVGAQHRLVANCLKSVFRPIPRAPADRTTNFGLPLCSILAPGAERTRASTSNTVEGVPLNPAADSGVPPEHVRTLFL